MRLRSSSALQTLLAMLLACGLCVGAPAQSSGDDSLHRAVITTWTTDQGLPQNFIRAIAQTADGFLWVGTMNGLARFDGVHFRTFDKDGPAELQQNIEGLAPDASGGLWIATATQLIHYQHQQFIAIPFAGKGHYPMEAMAAGRNGSIWIVSGGVLTHTEGGALVTHAMPALNQRLRDLAEGSDGTLWFADGDAVYAVRGNAAAARYPLAGARMLYTDDFGDVYAGDGHRLFRFDGHTFQLVAKPGLGNFVSILVDRQRRLWMASGGLHGLSRKMDGNAEVLTTADGLAANDVRLIFEDRSGDIWLGTISGLQRLHRGIFTTYGERDGLAINGDQLEAVFAQKNGAIWAGSLEGGVARFADGNWHHYGRADGLSPGQVRGFIENGAMPAIAISDYGIFALQGRRFSKLSGIPHGYVGTPVATRDGSFWFSVDRQGLFRRRDGETVHISASEGLPNGSVHSISIDRSDALWVGVANDLMRWNGARFDKVLTYPSPVLNVTWPPGGAIAAGVLNGLLLKPSSTAEPRLLTQKEGLPGDTVLDTLSDDDGNLWIATARAIARLKHDDWMAFAEHRADHVEPELFLQSDGLKNDAVLPLNEVTATRAPDGRLWFATPRGVSVIDPKLKPEPPVPAVLDSVIVDDKPQIASNFTVPPGQHRVTFVFTAPPGAGAELTHFRYRLSGWDNAWIDAGNAREVSYTALPPRSYRFDVIAINREGIASLVPASINMRLKPFFWQTRTFLILATCLVIAIIVEITRRRTRVNAERLSLRFQERVAERERIAYQIHDTVIQDMIGAALQLELLGFQIHDNPEQSDRLLDSLARRLRETIERSRNMVWSLHSTAVTQYSLVEVLRHAEAEFRLSELPAFELISEGEPRHIHTLVRDEVYRICREALANAFRHANAEHVRVIVRFLPQALEVEIGDDGQGIDEETQLHGRPGHFGLPGMRAHAERVGAQLTMLSAPGQGTRILLRVKARESWWRWPGKRRFLPGLLEQNEVTVHDNSD